MNIEVDANKVNATLSQRIAQLEYEKAVLQTALEEAQRLLSTTGEDAPEEN